MSAGYYSGPSRVFRSSFPNLAGNPGGLPGVVVLKMTDILWTSYPERPVGSSKKGSFGRKKSKVKYKQIEIKHSTMPGSRGEEGRQTIRGKSENSRARTNPNSTRAFPDFLTPYPPSLFLISWTNPLLLSPFRVRGNNNSSRNPGSDF